MPDTILLFTHDDIIHHMGLRLRFFEWEVNFVSSIDDLFQELKRRPDYYKFLILEIVSPVPQECKHISFTEQEFNEMRNGSTTGIVLAKKIWEAFPNDYPIIFISSISRFDISSDQVLKEHKCDYFRLPERLEKLDHLLCDMEQQYGLY